MVSKNSIGKGTEAKKKKGGGLRQDSNLEIQTSYTLLKGVRGGN